MAREHADDPYRRLNYRRLIAWPERIRREWPFLESRLRAAPEASVLDLGCGTGEHAEHCAAHGFRTVGVERSEAQVAQARDYENRHPPHGPRFVVGDIGSLAELGEERFGAAICLGNTLPHLEDDHLDAALAELGRHLVAGGLLILQILNYESILGQGIRSLPVNFRDEPEGDGEVVFVRLMTPDGDRHVLFHPLTLTLRPGAEPPVELRAAREVRLRAWRRPELERALQASGFAIEAVYGDMVGGGYDADSSPDLVVVAALRGAIGG